MGSQSTRRNILLPLVSTWTPVQAGRPQRARPCRGLSLLVALTQFLLARLAPRAVLMVALLAGLTLVPAPTAYAAVQACTEAGLDAALAAGLTNTFSCVGATTITVSATKTVSVSGTVLDGGGLLTISGGGVQRVFIVDPGVTATFQNLTIANGADATGGGGILNNGTLTIRNSTFSGNSTTFFGGGILNGGTLTISNSTFSGNSAATLGGGIYQNGGTVTLKNTIVANSTSGDNCSAAIADGGNNLDSANTCGFTVNAKINTNPNLGALTGSPAYFPLNTGSAAIDAGDNAICAAAPVSNASQNGVTRPVDGDSNGTATCDIGSYEAPAADTTPVPTLSEWAMLLMGLLLVGLGLHQLRRRRLIA